jgi:hypothetical protein
MNNSLLLIACENDNELLDLQGLLQLLPLNLFSQIHFWGTHTTPVTESLFIDTLSTHRQVSVKRLDFDKKQIHKLIFTSFKFQKLVLLTGVSLSQHRLLKLLRPSSCLHISILRAPVVKDDRIFSRQKLARWLPFKPLRYFLKNYAADCIFVTGDTTRQFLITEARLDPDCVLISGPIAADHAYKTLAKPTTDSSGRAIQRIVFLPSAFKWHGDDEGDRAQQNWLSTCISQLQNSSLKEVPIWIRIHPRDICINYDKFQSLNIAIDDGTLPAWDKHPLEHTLFISQLSSLIFELNYLGASGFFISDSFFAHKYAQWYERNGITALSGIHQMEDMIRDNKSLSQGSPQVLSVQHRGSVSTFITRHINEMITQWL